MWFTLRLIITKEFVDTLLYSNSLSYIPTFRFMGFDCFITNISYCSIVNDCCCDARIDMRKIVISRAYCAYLCRYLGRLLFHEILQGCLYRINIVVSIVVEV